MTTHRLDSAERRTAIISAALPLFARRGFAATTTREIATAAGVSEALIFKHFPNKAALYEAIFTACIEGDPELAELLAQPPSTAALVQFVRALVNHYLIEVPADPVELQSRKRLMLLSLLEDGEFASLAYRWAAEQIHPAFTASLLAARAAGDLVDGPLRPENALWLSEHLLGMLAAIALANRPVVPYVGAMPDLVRQVEWFILRGLGLRDEVIDAQLALPAPAAVCSPLSDPQPRRP